MSLFFTVVHVDESSINWPSVALSEKISDQEGAMQRGIGNSRGSRLICSQCRGSARKCAVRGLGF